MSEELETYTMTQDEEIKWLRQCVRELQQENQQLKEMQCTYLGTGCTRRRQQLETVLDEIREYIKENTWWFDEELGLVEMKGYNTNRTPVVYTYYLQNILDKVNND